MKVGIETEKAAVALLIESNDTTGLVGIACVLLDAARQKAGISEPPAAQHLLVTDEGCRAFLATVFAEIREDILAEDSSIELEVGIALMAIGSIAVKIAAIHGEKERLAKQQEAAN